jgi:hypothetical protein
VVKNKHFVILLEWLTWRTATGFRPFFFGGKVSPEKYGPESAEKSGFLAR